LALRILEVELARRVRPASRSRSLRRFVQKSSCAVTAPTSASAASTAALSWPAFCCASTSAASSSFTLKAKGVGSMRKSTSLAFSGALPSTEQEDDRRAASCSRNGTST